jgi:hypothetical protein
MQAGEGFAREKENPHEAHTLMQVRDCSLKIASDGVSVIRMWRLIIDTRAKEPLIIASGRRAVK